MNDFRSSPDVSYIEQYFSPLKEYLTDDSINEVVINPDNSIFVEEAGSIHMHQINVALGANAIKRLGVQLAGEARNTLGVLHPIVSRAGLKFGATRSASKWLSREPAPEICTGR